MNEWPELAVSVLGIRHRDNSSELRRRTQGDQSLEVDATVTADGLAITTSRIPDGESVHVRATLTAEHSGIGVRGVITSRWEGECRRCLEIVAAPISADLEVMFLDEASFSAHEPGPDEIDVYAFDAETVDLGEVVREELMLALPLAPLCSEACVGADPERFSSDEPGGDVEDEASDSPIDPRWAALSELTFDEE